MAVASKLAQSPSGQLKSQTKKLESSPKHIVVISNQLASPEPELGHINGITTLDRDAPQPETNQPSAKTGPKARALLQKRGTLNGAELTPKSSYQTPQSFVQHHHGELAGTARSFDN